MGNRKNTNHSPIYILHTSPTNRSLLTCRIRNHHEPRRTKPTSSGDSQCWFKCTYSSEITNKICQNCRIKAQSKIKGYVEQSCLDPNVEDHHKGGSPPTGAEGGWAARYTWRVPHFRTPELLCLHSKYGEKKQKTISIEVCWISRESEWALSHEMHKDPSSSNSTMSN